MNTLEMTEARRQQVHRRLNELEIAAGIGSELDMAWHIAQAARGGASLAEVLAAIRLGMEMRGTPGTVLTQCTSELVKRVFHVRGASRFTRPSTVNELSLC